MPGTIIRERSARVARGLPTDTGVLFLAGPADKGPQSEALLVQSLAEFERKFGPRVTYSSAYDMVDGFFGEGGNKLYFSRILGPAPSTASANLLDAGAAVSLIADAASPGEWGNSLNVAVEAGDAAGEFKIRVTHDTDTTIDEVSPSLVDQNAAVEWARASDHIRLRLGASSNDPAVVAATSLTGGADDRANINDASALTALNNFKKDLGPGQVAYANRTTSAAHGQLADHAKANNRVALYDPPDTTSKTTLVSTAAAVRGLSNGKYGALFAPWVNLGSLTPGAGDRPVPPSCIVAGIIARNDARGVSPNQPSAGDLGLLSYGQGVRATFTKADSDELNDASCNILLEKAGELRVYGYRSGTSKTSNPNWWQFSNVRFYMTIAARADNILEGYVLKQVDGRRLLLKKLEGELLGMLGEYYPDSLFGETPQEAFAVDTESVNTDESLANGELHAVLEVRMSPFAETVILDIVKVQIA